MLFIFCYRPIANETPIISHVISYFQSLAHPNAYISVIEETKNDGEMFTTNIETAQHFGSNFTLHG